jgi:hypothetical protein
MLLLWADLSLALLKRVGDSRSRSYEPLPA